MVDEYNSDDYIYSVDDLCEMFGVSKTSVSTYIKSGVISPNDYKIIRYSGEGNRRIFYNLRAVKAIEEWLKPPEGWITTKDINDHYGVTSSHSNRFVREVDNYKQYRRKCGSEYYYDPIILDLIGNRNLRTYVTLKVTVPPKEWFTCVEFGNLFGKSRCSVWGWISTGRIPSDCVQKIKNVYYVHRDAVQYVDGKAYDNFNGTRKDLKLEPDNDEPIELDDCVLTPSEHKRRLKIFYNKFNQISPAAVDWLASLGLTVADL